MKPTPRRRVMNVLHGEIPDKTPFTLYTNKLPRCTIERELRSRGLCMIERTTSYQVARPNVTFEEHRFINASGKLVVKTIFHTPVGDLSMLVEPAGFTSWTHEYLFKSPDDYKAILFMIKDSVVTEDYARAAKLEEVLGEDFAVRDNLPSEPLQTFISGSYFDPAEYCMQWMDNRDEMLKLYDAQVELTRKIYPIAVKSPLQFCNFGGNVVPQIVGRESFSKYYIPIYNEAAEEFHKVGKFIGTHLDAENQSIMDLVAQTHLDYIEAYDPGMSPSVSDARKAWPDKVLWINFPSAWHLRSPEEVYKNTLRLIEEAKPGNNFIIGITEDVPEGRWAENYTQIMNAIGD